MSGPQLYLVLELSPSGVAEARLRLAAAFAVADFKSVLLRPRAGTAFEPPAVKSLIEIIQAKDAAALVEDDAGLARALKADGVHLSWSKDQRRRFADAREQLGERYIIGADAGRSRHDAMELAEAGASYVGFGIPPHVEDRATAFARQTELLRWWGEIFEIPCVAFDAAEAETAAQLAAAGADFIAVTIAADASPGDAGRIVEGYAAQTRTMRERA